MSDKIDVHFNTCLVREHVYAALHIRGANLIEFS